MKKGVLKNFANFTGKQLCWSLFLEPQASNFIKKRLQHSCFPTKFPKFLRSPILKNIRERLPLKGLLSLLFYCESGIYQYAVQKILTDVFGASL